MCVIIGGLRKNLRRAEQLEGMRCNPSGFAIAVLRGGKLIAHKRSLLQKDIMDIWDTADDEDYIVTHSRIPSMGGMHANVDDCHLWEREGCLLAHNGTMVNMKEAMESGDRRTDSQAFFEEIFIPLWKSQGKNINPLVEKVIRTVTHGNRICIITPDGEVHYYGEWVKDHDCMMSNSSYRITTTSYAGFSQSYGGRGGYSYLSDEDDYDEWWKRRSGTSSTLTEKEKETKPAASTAVTNSVFDYSDFDGSILKEAAGDDLFKLMILHYVVMNAITLSSAEQTRDDKESAEVATKLLTLMGAEPSGALCDFVTNDLPQFLTEPNVTEKEIDTLATDFAAECEIEFCPAEYKDDKQLARDMLVEFYKAIRDDEVAAAVMNTHFNWEADSFRKLVTSWKMALNRKKKPTIVNRSLAELAYVPLDDGAVSPATFDIAVENLSKLYDRFRKGGKA